MMSKRNLKLLGIKRMALTSLVLTSGLWLSGCNSSPSTRQNESETSNSNQAQTYNVPVSDHVQFELQERLINAVPGDVIQLEEGVYELHSQLDLVCDNLTIRGRGQEKTILSFGNQKYGSEGIVATGDNFVIESLAVENSVGNAIKVLGADGVIFRDVRAEWTGEPSPDNGAYGIYPVQCSNVLIEDCIAIGASDAGIYVGQSQDVVVRRCRVERNVAGIEIENTHRADVYENVATENTGGLLVFDLPGLPVTNGGHIRVFKNKVFKNNLDNFAAPGNIVATVPAGTGLMIMAADQVEVFDNDITDNQTTGVSIVSYLVTGRPINDPKYDPFSEGIWIHDNRIEGGGDKPSGELAMMLSQIVGTPFPQIFYDGIINVQKIVDGQIPDEIMLRLSDNGDVTFANANLGLYTPENVAAGRHKVDRDLKPYIGKHEALDKTVLKELAPASDQTNPAVAVYRQAPKKLSQWGLFKGNVSSQKPIDGVFRYDLNTQLFSDYAVKFRFIRLPDGKPMVYQPDSVFEFPVGTIIAKTFAYPQDMRKPQEKTRLLETRIQQHTETGWYGFSYVWNDEQTEAELALGGGSKQVSWIHTDGKQQTNSYQIPNANQCLNCHSQADRFVPLGPTARNLNREFQQDHGHANQLEHWQDSGQLTGMPDQEQIPLLPVFHDESTGNVAQRARAWLDVNCAHCHSPTGTARTSGLDLRLSQTDLSKVGVWKSPVATGRGSGNHRFDIVPGKPEESILIYRLESDEAGVRMPNLARNLSHSESTAVIRAWIASMPAEDPKPAE